MLVWWSGNKINANEAKLEQTLFETFVVSGCCTFVAFLT